MQFAYKAAKLVTGEAYASARRHLRQWQLGRAPLDVEAARLVRTIDREGLQTIFLRRAIERPGHSVAKYLDVSHWMEINLRRARELSLDLGGRKQILDLGSGCGYFLYICRQLGHNALGLDLDNPEPLFSEMSRLLGVRRVNWRIEAFVPLPNLRRKFNIITAHMICFNGHKTKALWQVPEWDFFLDELAARLTPDGIVSLELNREHDGSLYKPELKDFFESRGGIIHTQRIVFPQLRLSPGAIIFANFPAPTVRTVARV